MRKQTSKLLAALLHIGVLLWITHPVQSNSHQLITNGWTISAGPEESVLTVEYDKLGVVLKDLQLHVKQGDEWRKLTNWEITTEDNRLLINTGNPSIQWIFYIRNRVLGITTNIDEGLVTAVAPADINRFPSRMIDFSGRAKPVAWKGTDEIGYSYGGNQTKNLSFLPADNPEVLYLSLGQVSSRNLHCLFDRKVDAMLKFSSDTRMWRVDNDPDQMQIKLQIGNSLPFDGSIDVEILTIYNDYYTDILGLPVYEPIDETHFKVPPVIWNSWTNYYYKVTEDDVIRNVDWIVNNLSAYGLKYIVIDDGPERGEHGEHYWISNWNKETFPHGPQWLVEYIKSKNLKAGLWVVPNSYSGAIEDHPEWYLKDKEGNFIMDYNTPALDCTNPEVLDFLTSMFTTLKDWGFEYYKFDGEFALTEYIPSVNNKNLYDNTITPLDAYRNRLKVIRKAVEDNTFIEGCPAGTPLQGIGFFNSYFNGDDIYNSWLGMYPFFNSINANLFLNHIVCYLMPGEGICVSPKMNIKKAKTIYNPEFIRVASSREEGISSVGTTMKEARTIATFAALSGTPYSFADRLPDLPEERIELLRKTLPAMPIVPIDLFSRGSYSTWTLFREFTSESYTHDFPRIINLKINAVSGIYDVVATTNWTVESQSRSIPFEDKLGLDPEKLYLVFDFWNQTLVGIFQDHFTIDIDPHDTRVFHIRPLVERPQILATDRHISGAYSIKMLKWDGEKLTLNGTSKTIPNTPYSVFAYVPNGYYLSEIDTETTVLLQEIKDHLLKVTLKGQDEIVTWSLLFKKE